MCNLEYSSSHIKEGKNNLVKLMYFTKCTQNSSVNKKMRYFAFFKYQVFKTQCILYPYCISHFGVATFHVLITSTVIGQLIGRQKLV